MNLASHSNYFALLFVYDRTCTARQYSGRHKHRPALSKSNQNCIYSWEGGQDVIMTKRLSLKVSFHFYKMN